MQRLRRALVGTAVACLALPLGIGSAVAHDDDDDDDDALEVEVIATGLDSPRGLALDRRENVWIAQAGRGGDDPTLCIPGLEGPDSPPRCLGATGKISVLRENDDDDDRRDRRGGDDDHDDDGYTVHDVVTGLPSLATAGAEAIGPSDVTFDRRGRLLATIGLGADPTFRTTLLAGAGELAAQLATVRRVDTRQGTTSLVADLGQAEIDLNPEREDLDTNPNSIVVKNGVRYVADAGGNVLWAVDRDGDVSVRHVFEFEDPVPDPFNPDPAAPQIAADPVPNSVVRGPDGAVYVGQLTGFPFTIGTATVWRVEKNGDAPVMGNPPVFADGFTNIIDIAFDDHDNLLVLEIAHNSLLGTPPDTPPIGALIQVSRHDGTQRILLDDLTFPGGMVVDDDDVYISNNTVAPGMGEILKVELDD